MSSTKTSPPSPSEPGPDDELHGLRDRHEVARHALVGHRHRPARRDLAAEDRHDRARGAQDVAEAHGGELRLPGPALLRRPRPTRPAPSRRPSPSRAPRPCRWRRARTPDARLAGHPRDEPRGERVVAHRLDRVGLHEARRACRRRRGRRPSGGAPRTPRASAPPPCSRRARRRARSGARGGPPPARAGWRRGCPRRGRGRRAAAARRARSGGTARAPIEPPAPGDDHDLARSGSRRRGRAPCATGSRPSTSSTCTSRTWPDVAALDLQQLEDRRQRADGDPAVAAGADHAGAERARRRRDRDGDLVGLGLVEDPRQLRRSGRAP